MGLLTKATIAEELSRYCYAIDTVGLVDLTELCTNNRTRGSKRRVSVQKMSDTDKDFIEAYRQEINRFPVVRDNILGKLDRSPIGEVNRAKQICGRETGSLTLQSDREEDVSAEEVREKLARQFYCPESLDKPQN